MTIGVLPLQQVKLNISLNLITLLYVSEMNEVMMSQGIQCEKNSYTKAHQKQLMQYWKLVSNYKIFHRNGVRKLHSGKSSEVRTLTWHCDSTYKCGGLGYRILGIVANLLFAIATNRVLLLKWDKTSAEIHIGYLT